MGDISGATAESSKSDQTTRLHPAYTVTNIHQKVRTLDGVKVSHSSWVLLFNIHVTAFRVSDHIDGTKPPLATDESYKEWKEVDALVLQWIYATLSDDLFARVLRPVSTAREAWVRIENIFLNNKGARAAALEAEFQNITLQSMPSLEAYCQRIKELSDQLGTLDAPVSDQWMVLKLVRGLPPEYDVVGSLLNQQLPTWEEACNSLYQERQRQIARQAVIIDPAVAAVVDSSKSQHQNYRPKTAHSSSNNNQNRRPNNSGRRPSGSRSNQSNQQRSTEPTAKQPSARPPASPYPFYGFPYWAPPPCPFPTQGSYPTQGSWFGPPWQPHQPTVQPHQQQSTGSSNNAQAHLTQYDAMQPTQLAAAFQALTTDPVDDQWYMDTGASSHITPDQGKLSNLSPFSSIASVLVGNGTRIPVLGSGHTTLPTSTGSLNLENVLYNPTFIKNLVSVRKFATDNFVSVEFDPFGFSIKNFRDGMHLSRHNSSSQLYPFTTPESASASAYVITTPTQFWHERLGHPGRPVMDFLCSNKLIACNKPTLDLVCHACQLAKSKRLPFNDSITTTSLPFSIVHCDLWTSPIPSTAGYKYYMVLVDDFTNYTWVYPLKFKSETFARFAHFHRFVKTQFNLLIKTFQCDMGGEFNNHTFQKFASTNGMESRFSCPHTSQQNGKSERMIRRLNEIMLTLLTRASLPSKFWVEALHTACYLHNILPSKTLHNLTPTTILYRQKPSYDHLRVFGCACYPNTTATRPHKLALRSTPCVFLGYPANYRGYRCLDLSSGKIIFSRHVVFDEIRFPFHSSNTTPDHSFLDDPPPNPHFTHNFPPKPSTDTTPTPPPDSPFQFYEHTYQRRSKPPTSQPTTTTSAARTIPPTNTATGSSHPMLTRSRSSQTTNVNLHTESKPSLSPLPISHLKALNDPNWKGAMANEYKALLEAKTWDLVPRPPNVPVIRCLWLFKHKFNSDGVLERYKARLVANGKSQTVGVDCDETFSPVVKPTTIRTVLSLAVSRSWPMHQLDVQNAFLHGDLNETVYMHQPPGFKDPAKPDFVCRLNRSLYGLKQAPRAWYQRFANFLVTCGFKSSICDTSLFIYKKGTHMAYLLLYVDDIILTASSSDLLQQIIKSLSAEFAMKDLGNLNHFLGIKVDHEQKGLFLSQSSFAESILKRANMLNCKPVSTPVEIGSKLSASSGAPVVDGTHYRSLAGALQYLTITRPDLSYAVQQVCLFMHDPREPHFQFLKRILRYVKGTISYGLSITPSPSDRLVAYSDADWGGCPDTRRSTSGFCVFLGHNLISWSSKRQPTISRSSAEAEYRGVANTVAETSWIRNLLLELGLHTRQATVVYCDNISTVYLSQNPVQHQRTKHVEMDIHFVREKVQVGDVRVLHVPAEYQYADIFTKGLAKHLFTTFRSSLCLRPATAQTTGAC
ncbi:hypothetical protein QVD17_30928 [Tagetes erecta]|uniref:Integrase catalytic domain-containing protein n=1 Tax=Tagetes erecta TaxID=13708 RepID=A0AAD8NNR0_TARER|nr:hypothetical protein QVD17_30928 [Tagetes erecta]